jgi:hypothetical protein
VTPRRRRWLRWTLVALVALILLLRFGVVLALPGIAEWAMAKMGLSLRWESLHVSALSGSIAFTDVSVRELGRDGDANLLDCSFAEVDLDLAALLSFRFHVRRLTLEGVETSLVRGADGRIGIEGWSGPPGPAKTKPGEPPAEPDLDAPFDFRPLVPFGQVSIHDVRVRFRDAAVAPEVSTVVTIDARLDRFGAANRPGRIDARLSAPGVVDELLLQGEGAMKREGMSGRFGLVARGLSGDVARRYSGLTGVAPRAQRLDLDAAVDVELSVADAERRQLKGHATLARLELDGDAEEEFWSRAHVEIAKLTRRELEIPGVTVDARVRAQRLASGAWRLAGIERAQRAAPPPAEPPPAPPASRGAPFVVRVGEIRPALALALRDELAAPPVETTFTLRDASVKELVLGAPSETPLEAELVLEAATESGSGSLHVAAICRPFAKPRDATIEARATGLRALLAALGVGSDLEQGELELRLTASADTEGDPMSGKLAVETLRVRDGERELFAVEGVSVSKFEIGRGFVAGERLEIAGATLSVTKDAEKRLHVAGIALPAAVAAARHADEVAVTVPSRRPPTAFRLAELALTGARVNWSDRSVEPPAEATLELDAKVAGVDTAANEAAPVELVAKVAGALEELRIAGAVTPDPDALRVELDVAAEGVRPGPLMRALAAESKLDVNEGTLRLHASAALDRTQEGGRSLRFELKDVDARAGPEGEPRVTIGRIALVAPQIDAQAGPVVVEELSISAAEVVGRPSLALDLRNREPMTVWSREPEKLAPFALDLTIRAPKVAREVKLALEAAPYAQQPTLSLALDASGLDGAGLAELLPSAKIDAEAIHDGTLSAKVDFELDLRRRGPASFDLRDGVGASIAVRDVLLRGSPDGEPLVAIERIDVDSAKLRAATGDVLVKSVDVHAPRAFVRRGDRGLEVAGLLFPPLLEASAGPPPEAPSPEPPAPAAEPEAPRGPELRIDDVTVTGFDLQYVDDTTTPRLVVPFEAFELDLRGFSTRALHEPRPIQFRASVHGGDLQMEHREQRTLVGGVLESATSLVSEREVENERRPAWEAIDVSGNMTLARPITGWARVETHALELQALRGVGQRSGVDIQDGVLDSTIDARFRGKDGAVFDLTSTFSRLSVQEPADGPISRWLKLRLPLDTTLFLLRNDEGQQRITLRFKVEEEGIGRGQVAAAATAALLKLIAEAIEGAPMRIVRGTLDTVQLTKLPGWEKLPGLGDIPGISKIPGLNRLFGVKEEVDQVCEPVAIELAPGSTRMPGFARDALEEVLDEMRDDRDVELIVTHELGEEDRGRLARLAQPRPEDVVALGERLRRERDELAARHARIAEEARAAYSLGRAEAATAARESLRETDRELAVTESAIDRLFENFGERTSRQQERLVRQAAQSLAEERIAALHELLKASGIRHIDRRIEVRPGRAAAASGKPTSRLVVEARRAERR